ncbi:beta-ketoacyl reductase, partial [Kitasatospora sp. NPDC008050]|uniref:type I polyketide synthase n=1 Tax=Kitasatospora sp. NPDC008050 TaxID=3364021 RepID=UPI0036E1D146
PLDRSGTALITGATGMLGSLIARHLVHHHGIRHLILTSRRGPNAPGATQLTTELTNAGAHITLTACDTTNPQEIQHLLTHIHPDHPLTTVIHTAGTLDDALTTNLTPHQLHTVLQPKIDAATNLHHHTKNHPLTHFILFSSAAGLLGAAGQANYAAANTYLDALAHHRHHHGLPATSLAWGAWTDTNGMTAQLTDIDLNRMTRAGVQPLTEHQGLTLFDTTLTLHTPNLAPLQLNPHTLQTQANNHTLPHLLHNLTRTPLPRATTNHTTTNHTLTQQLHPLTPTDQHRTLLELIRTHTATVLGHTNPHTIDPKRTFREHGFDSLAAIELRNTLNTATGLQLTATLIFDHPTPEDLATHLLTEL